jgi:hypothetical protein
MRYVLFIDEATKGIQVKDLKTKEQRAVADVGELVGVLKST